MKALDHFKFNPSIDVTASHLGINRNDWESISVKDEALARDIMKRNRFDVLPHVSEEEKVEGYFVSSEWNNYQQVLYKLIDDRDCFYYRLSFDDLIKQMAKTGRYYFFLSNHTDILGLVSIVNFNCHAALIYMYQMMSDLERTITVYLKSHLSAEKATEFFKRSEDKHCKSVFSNYNRAFSKNIDSTIWDYLYLQDVGFLIENFDQLTNRNDVACSPVLLQIRPKLSRDGSFTKLRNRISHPTRYLISDIADIDLINEVVSDYYLVKQALNE